MTEKQAVLSPEALDFGPELLAMLYMVSALFFILLVWGVVGRLAIVASVEGKIVPKACVKIVQPADSGIVK